MTPLKMVDFLLFCFASVGMTLIVVNSVIFEPLRVRLHQAVERLEQRRRKKGMPPSFTLLEFFRGIVHCVQCMGFWSGLFCGLFLVTSDSLRFGPDANVARIIINRMLMLFCCGVAGSFLSMAGNLLLEWLFFSKQYFEHQTLLSAESMSEQPMPEDERIEDEQME